MKTIFAGVIIALIVLGVGFYLSVDHSPFIGVHEHEDLFNSSCHSSR